MTKRHYAIDVAASAIGVPASTIRRWISEGRLRSLLHNGRRYVTLTDCEHARDAPKRRSMLRNLTK